MMRPEHMLLLNERSPLKLFKLSNFTLAWFMRLVLTGITLMEGKDTCEMF